MQEKSRTDAIVLILFISAALHVPTAVVLRHFFDIDPLALLHINWGRTVVGVTFSLLATAVTGLNFYLSIIAPWMHQRQHGNMQNYSNISGIPAIGGFFIFCAGALLPSSIAVGTFLLTLYTLDTGGLPWFLYCWLSEEH